MDDIENFITNRVFIKLSADDQERREVKELVLETCKRIKEKNARELSDVLPHIELLAYMPIPPADAGDTRGKDGGATEKLSWRFIVFYYPKNIIHEETKLYALAHEFAHVYHKHILSKRPQDSEEIEFEADKKAIEWGFRPHERDLLPSKFETFKRNLARLERECPQSFL